MDRIPLLLILQISWQILSKDPTNFAYKVSGYLSSVWNKFDWFVHFLFILAIILRFVLDGKNFVYARIFYCLTLVGFYLRFMQAFFVSKNIGPKVIMIQRMVRTVHQFYNMLHMFNF